MDSCHIFNFLFGSRKTTSELRKHFKSSFSETENNVRQSKRNKTTANKSAASLNKEQPSGSPLKQIHQKLSNLTSSPKRVSTEAQCCHTNCEPKCGTYHAKLVDPSDYHFDEHKEYLVDENNNLLVSDEKQICELTVSQPNEVASQDEFPKQIVLYDSLTRDEDCSVITLTEVYEIKSPLDSQTRSAISNRVQTTCGGSDRDIEPGTIESQTRRGEFRDKKSAKSDRVKNLVQSFELSSGISTNSQQIIETLDSPRTPIKLKWPPEQLKQDNDKQKDKPTTIVKPLPPKTPPKSNKVKFLNLQLRMRKPNKIEQLFQDEHFLTKFFSKLEPIDRCVAAQVCRTWRSILYSNQDYWRDLTSVIDCTQLRREHLLECIINTLQSAKLKHLSLNSHHHQLTSSNGSNNQKQTEFNIISPHTQTSALAQRNGQLNMDLDKTNLDQDEIWKIQELCQRFTRGSNNYSSRSLITDQQQQQQQVTISNQHQHDSNQHMITSKSSSIPSQISSTISSASISSLLSPLSESSRIESIKERLYTTLDDRGFDAICLYGASDDDIQDLISKTPPGTHKRILIGRLDNCCITDRGLELFVSTFDRIEELELSGCNEISNNIDLKPLHNLDRLIITDCINIADGLASKLVHMFHQISKLTIQAYHLTDAFLEFISLNSDTSKLKQLELPNCKEVTNHSMLTIAKHYPNVEQLSISGSTKISDDGIEILGEQAKNLRRLDLSWCTKISDISLECIACDLSANLRELILDRNMNITDIGLGYLATMSNLTLLYIRWCSRVTDIGLESVLTIKNLKNLSLAGLHQITARSLLCLIEANSLEEVELTNCPTVSNDLMEFLSSKMPKCNIVF